MILLALFSVPFALAQSGYPGGGGSGGGYPGGGGGGYPGSADTYSVTYSGGTTTVNGTPTPYSASTNSSAPGDWGGGAYTYIPSGGSAAISCAGKITATFTWNGGPNNDPAPPSNSVVVAETVNAAWSGPNSSGGSDIPGGTIYTQSPTYIAMRYSLQGGSSFTVTCTPSASMSGSMPPGYQISSGSAYVGYTARATPILTLTGGIGSTWNKSLLIGQQLSAMLNTAGLQANPCNWTVSGGSPFLNYIVHADNNIPSNNSAVYTPFSPQTGTSLTCYFASPTTTASVACTAHLIVPAGASPSAGLDITLSPSLTIEKPSASLNIFMGGISGQPGGVIDLPTSTNPTDVQLQRFYYYPPDGNAKGIEWQGTITTPAAYVTSGNYGIWNWIQLMTASRKQKTNGVYWPFAVFWGSPTQTKQINNWPVLDGMYPYWYQSYTSDGTPSGNSDSPAQPLPSDNTIREYDVGDSFQDFLMYQPPGSGSVSVPLEENDWYWQFQALKDSSNAWSTGHKNDQWGFVAYYPSFPTWSFCALVNHLTYVSP